MARYRISSVSLFSPHFKWAATRIRFNVFLYRIFSTRMCFLNERCESHHTARNFADSSTGRSVFQYLQWWVSKPWIGVQWNVRLCTCGQLTWTYSLSRIRVWHLLPAVNISLWCPGNAHKNTSPGHRQRVLWICTWQYKRAAHWSSVQNMSQPRRHELEHLYGSTKYLFQGWNIIK